jgi:hypothetical protein
MGAFFVACAWECKLPGRELSPEQAALRNKMITAPNAWRYRIIHSALEAVRELRELDII